MEKCLVCQQNKVETINTPGLLQPLLIPSQRWEEVSMDFITGLPKSEGKSVIMVVVDRLTKYAHFCALSHPFCWKSNPLRVGVEAEQPKGVQGTTWNMNPRVTPCIINVYLVNNRCTLMFIIHILLLPCMCLPWYESGRYPALLIFDPLLLCPFCAGQFCHQFCIS